MGGCPRSGHGAMIRMCGPKDMKCVPMEIMHYNHKLNEFVSRKIFNHQGPPKALVGTGGFKLKKENRK